MFEQFLSVTDENNKRNMKFKISMLVMALLVMMVCDTIAAPANDPTSIKELYRTSSTDGNKSSRDEVAYLNEASGTLRVYGRYKFVAPSGIVATVYYYADENGYRAKSIIGPEEGGILEAGFIGEVGPLAGVPALGETEKGGYESEIIPPEVLKSLLG